MSDVTAEPVLAQPAEPHEPSHIGPRLRAQREQLGLSLRELARRIGVSASLISQIERDKVNPSVSTLYSLVRELGLGMGDLFSADGERPSAPAAASAHSPLVTPESMRAAFCWEGTPSTSMVTICTVSPESGDVNAASMVRTVPAAFTLRACRYSPSALIQTRGTSS